MSSLPVPALKSGSEVPVVAVTATPAPQPPSYDEIVASIMKLDPDKWASEGAAAVYGIRSRKGADILAKKLFDAASAASDAASEKAMILRCRHSLDPESHAFRLFKAFKVAKILVKKPELAHELKLQLYLKNPNALYGEVFKWVDTVAENPGSLLEGIKVFCEQVDHFDIGDGLYLKETLVAMEFYFEEKYDELCTIYPEYKTIPKL